MLKLPCLLAFIVGVSTATAADTEPAAVEDPLINMYRKQETLLANIQKEMLLKFNEVAARFSEMSNKRESLDKKYEVSLAEIKSRLFKLCPAGFLRTVHGCYKFTTTNMNFKDADAECKRAGGHLLEIDSTSEAKDVADMIQKNNMPESWYYTGGLRRNGKWEWERTGAPMTYKKWYPGHPSSVTHYDRLRFLYSPSSSNHMTVYDKPPSYTCYSICEV